MLGGKGHCTNVAGVTCNIYHDGLTPFVNGAANFNASASEYNTCKAYGYGQYLNNTYSPVYGPVGNSLKNVIEYEAGSSVDDLMKWYPGQNQDSPCTQPVPVVSKNMFKEHLEDPSKNEFSFAREDDTCAITSTEVKDSELYHTDQIIDRMAQLYETKQVELNKMKADMKSKD